MHRNDLTYEEHQMVLELHMFLKQKRDRKIKVQKVYGGNKQRTYIPKEYANSPTVSTKSILLKIIINIEENRNVAVIGIPNAFI